MKSKSIQKREEAQVPAAAAVFEEEAGSGFEGTTSDDFAIPIVTILQALSPQLKTDHAKYNPEAKMGMVINTATGEIFDGNNGIVLCPCSYRRRMVEWRPRSMGGGYQGDFHPDDAILEKTERDDRGVFIIPDTGHELRDTRYHYCMLVTDQSIQPVILALTSTQIKKSRAWMTQMQNIKLPKKNAPDEYYTPPTFSHLYRLTTVVERKQDNEWYGWKIMMERVLGNEDANLIQAAVEFKKQVLKGSIKVDVEKSEEAEEEF